MKHNFSKTVVIVCIVVSLAITIVTLCRAELTSGVLAALYGFWGGELLLLCLKRIFTDKSTCGKITDENINNDTEDRI